MIGFWDYTVILTFMSLASSLMGIIMASGHNYTHAVIFLALSGLLDTFDGKVARTKKDRTDDEKAYGIQLDSLCDVIGFGVFPAFLCYKMGTTGFWGISVIVFYNIAAVTRLAYFNVLELNRQEKEGGVNKYYSGLPVTSIAVIFPLVYLVNYWISRDCKSIVLELMLLVTGLLFVLDFKVKKPSNRQLVLWITMVTVALFATIYLYHKSWLRVWGF